MHLHTREEFSSGDFLFDRRIRLLSVLLLRQRGLLRRQGSFLPVFFDEEQVNIVTRIGRVDRRHVRIDLPLNVRHHLVLHLQVRVEAQRVARNTGQQATQSKN